MWHLSPVGQTGSNRRPIQWYEMSSRCVLNTGNLTVKSSHIDNIKTIKNYQNYQKKTLQLERNEQNFILRLWRAKEAIQVSLIEQIK